jgi:hypothetical protein
MFIAKKKSKTQNSVGVACDFGELLRPNKHDTFHSFVPRLGFAFFYKHSIPTGFLLATNSDVGMNSL